MLLTWVTHVEDEVLKPDGKYDYTYTPYVKGIVVPDCCTDIQLMPVVRLAYKYEDLCEEGWDDKKPVWKMQGPDFHLISNLYPEGGYDLTSIATYCPYCGSALPDVQRRTEPLPNKVHRPVYDGDYCGTCNERSRNCTCMLPACGWEIVKPSDT